jgi:hypothetical protein
MHSLGRARPSSPSLRPRGSCWKGFISGASRYLASFPSRVRVLDEWRICRVDEDVFPSVAEQLRAVRPPLSGNAQGASVAPSDRTLGHVANMRRCSRLCRQPFSEGVDPASLSCEWPLAPRRYVLPWCRRRQLISPPHATAVAETAAAGRASCAIGKDLEPVVPAGMVKGLCRRATPKQEVLIGGASVAEPAARGRSTVRST